MLVHSALPNVTTT